MRPPPSSADTTGRHPTDAHLAEEMRQDIRSLQTAVTRLTTIVAFVGGLFAVGFGVFVAVLWDVRKDDTALIRETRDSTLSTAIEVRSLAAAVEDNKRKIRDLESVVRFGD